MMSTSIATPRTEIPNPAEYRPTCRSLNGKWDFAIDDTLAIRPLDERFIYKNPGTIPHFSTSIVVPFCPQSQLSGVCLTEEHPVMWYRKQVEISKEEIQGRVVLIFGAVDFSCTLWVNGTYCSSHQGGYTRFKTEISHAIQPGANEILLRVEDHRNTNQPRGKQSWQAPFSCWYRETSGIWQSVWLEFLPTYGIDRIQTKSSVTKFQNEKTGSTHLEVLVHPLDPCQGTIEVTVSHQGNVLHTHQSTVIYPVTSFHIISDLLPLWTLESPELIDIVVTMTTESGRDIIHTYTGIRQIEILDGLLHINRKPVYQKLILDQGYWSEGTYTAPTDLAIKTDILLSQKMGFNGCRKHAKIEDPRFYYWADKLGYLVWEELPSAYTFTQESQLNLLKLCLEMIERDSSHPSIVAWTLFNESWGIPDVHTNPAQQEFLRSLVSTVKTLDPTRLIVGNDGWEHVGGDIYGLHSYAQDPFILIQDINTSRSSYTNQNSKNKDQSLLSNNRQFSSTLSHPKNRLFMVTEFGGIGYRHTDDNRPDAWGYSSLAQSPDELLKRLSQLVTCISEQEGIAGFVYTQLTDVEQEVNGLLYSDRTPKIQLSSIRDVITKSS